LYIVSLGLKTEQGALHCSNAIVVFTMEILLLH